MSFGTFKGFYVYSYMIRWRIVLVSRCMYWFMCMSVSACMNSRGLGLLENVHSGFPGCWDFHVWKYLGLVVVMLYSGNARMMNSVWGSVYI